MSPFALQAADAELSSPPADSAAYHPGGHQLLPHAHLHDLQRVPLHCSGSRGRDGILSVQLEESSGCGHHRALPLMADSQRGLNDCSGKQFETGRHGSCSNHLFLLLFIYIYVYIYTHTHTLINRGLVYSP